MPLITLFHPVCFFMSKPFTFDWTGLPLSFRLDMMSMKAFSFDKFSRRSDFQVFECESF